MPKAAEAEAPRTKSLFEQLREGLTIDKHNLDECWVEQPDIFYRVASGLASAISARDTASLDLKSAIAELDSQLRNEAVTSGSKVTETSIAREIEQAPKIMDLKVALGQKEHSVAKWAALKEAYQQRSYALKDLTALHISNYYQTNSGSTPRDQAADNARAAAGAERRKRINKD